MTVKRFDRREFLRASGALGLAAASPPGLGQPAYPVKPVKIVVGFAAGGGTDVLARMAAQGLSERLGQPFVVENRSGAGGNIATTAVAGAPPDGYTLLVTSVGQVVVSPHTDPTLKVDPVKDLVHITMIGEGDYILAVHTDVPAKDIHEFIALAKQHPGRYNYGTAGAGSNLHLFTEYFMMTAGIQVQPVHYRGGAALTPDLLSGQIHVSLNGIHALDTHIKAGKLRPLLVLGKEREPRVPNVPTAREIGMGQLEVCTNWFGMHAPAGTPAPVVTTLNEAVLAQLRTAAAKEKLAGMGMRPMGDTPQAFSARIASDYKRFGEVARKANIQLS
jgi:tripartite-type tricarboxylate transporter receptor subunit TctC